MTRKHRLLERFLHDILKIGNDKVHKEACEMEHALSDETERALCLTLKSPDKCPDDEKIIPACELAFPTCDECRKWSGDNLEEIGKRSTNVISVTALKENQQGKIAFIRGNNKVLRRLLDLGLTPGTKICVTRVAPLKGPVELSVRGSQARTGRQNSLQYLYRKDLAMSSEINNAANQTSNRVITATSRQNNEWQ